MKIPKVAWLLVVLAVCPSAWSVQYTGSLDTATGGLTGTGTWDNGPASLSWVVEQIDATNWNYIYTIQVPQGQGTSISHFNLETSHEVNEDNILSTNWDLDELEFGFINDEQQGQPQGFDGIKFDDVSAVVGDVTTLTVGITLDKGPKWGDAWWKGGRDNTLYNSGLTADDPLLPPGTDPTSTEINNHLLVPDTINGQPLIIPEPLTMLAFGFGTVAVASSAWRRRRRAA